MFNMQDKILLNVPEHLRSFASETFDRFSINTVFRACHFLSQCMHESNDFKVKEENLNYSKPELIVKVFRKFDLDHDRVIDPEEIEFAKQFVHNPQKLANYVYADKLGNRDESSGDGWTHRGFGFIQTTGRTNQMRVMEVFGLSSPEQIKEDRFAMLSAGLFWDDNKINIVADGGFTEDVIKAVTKKINPALQGLADREAKLNKICDTLQKDVNAAKQLTELT